MATHLQQFNSENTIGIVAIGRNEARRLPVCMASLKKYAAQTVYVDSGSTDDSLSIVQNAGVTSLSLDTSRPFSAGRARNLGADWLLKNKPNIEFIQFIDGDCEFSTNWLAQAAQALAQNTQLGIVVGHLKEAYTEKSTYNALCALEWQSAAGDLKHNGDIGGIFMVRADVFKQIGGFNVDVIAGEDSELGIRVGLAGYKITKLDDHMATHDANMHTFGQWWKRAVRAGHAIGQRAHLNGNTPARDCVKERKSTFVWGITLPLLALVLLYPSRGMSFLGLLLAYAYLGLRIFQYRRRTGNTQREAVLYAKFTVMGKLANGLGLLKFYANKLRNRYHIIEYK